MNKLLPKLVAALTAIGFLAVVSWIFANAGTPPAAKSGAPGENNCGQCHSGNINTGVGNATLVLGNNETTYTPGQTYAVTITVTDPNFPRKGFQVTALANGAGPSVGVYTLTNTTNTSTQTATISGNARRYISHRNANSNGTWSFNWTAPTSNVGTITFYLVGNATNNQNNSSGDRVYTRTFNFSATPPPPPTAAFSAVNTSICPGSSVTFTDQSANSPTTWSWSFPGGNPATSTAASPTVAYSTPGTYSVTLIASNPSGSDTIEQVNYITVNEAPSLAGTPASTSCNGSSDGSIDLTVTATTGNTYLWSNGSTSEDPTALAAGTYIVTVTSGSGCTSVGTYTVAEPSPLSATTSSVASACAIATGTATASPTGGTPGYSYLWSSGDTAATASNLSAGTYTVTVSDANGCTSTAMATVSNLGAPTLSSSTASVSCNGGNDGVATVIPSGGTQPYSYAWSNGDTNATIVGLVAGTYTVTVTDGGQCIAVQSITITEPSALSLTSSSTVDTGTSDGSASVVASGGTSPFTYIWNNGATTATINNLSAGTYGVTVTDANGCTANTTVTVFFLVGAAQSMSNVPFNIGPNPFSDVLILRPNMPMVGSFVAHLVDIEGRIVLGQMVEADGMRPIRIGTAGIPAGIYLLMMVTDNGRMVQKVIKRE